MVFSANVAPTLPGLTGTINVLATAGIGAEKFAVSPGAAIGPMMFRASLAVTIDVWIEVSTGGGPFARTVVAAGVPIAPGVITPVPYAAAVPFIASDSIRMGISLSSAGTILVDLTAEFQISF
jgi:hypothetical protein